MAMFKRTCSSCHFFVRVQHPERGGHLTFEIGREQRQQASQGLLDWQRESESLCCHRGIWDEGVGFPGSSRQEQIAQLNRRSTCYYMPYQPGMLLPAAEKLQEARLVQTRELQKIRFAIYALVVAILTLVAKLFVERS